MRKSPKVLVPGSFDILHHGHVLFLNRCKNLGEVIIALGDDDYQTSYKREPILPYHIRKATLEALGFGVVRREKKQMRGICMGIDPDYLARGSDWRDNDTYLAACGLEWPYIVKNGISLVVFPNEGFTSTTNIIERAIESAS